MQAATSLAIEGNLAQLALTFGKHMVQQVGVKRHRTECRLFANLQQGLVTTVAQFNQTIIISRPENFQPGRHSFAGTLIARRGLAPVRTIARMAGMPEIINGDESRLRHVLTTLLDNAVKFTTRGEITLGAEVAEDGVRFWVSDTGIGVPADKMEAIFKPFEQADDSNTRHYGGAGLGLAIARRLVELMGGTLWADSSQEVGSTFHITLREVVCD